MKINIGYAGIVQSDLMSYVRGWYGTVEGRAGEAPRRFYVTARATEHARLDFYGNHRWARSIRLNKCSTDAALVEAIKAKLIELTNADHVQSPNGVAEMA